MKVVCCAVQCSCGGTVKRLTDDGVFYMLTPQHHIIFTGICEDCEEPVKVERDILSLMMLCPIEKAMMVN